MRGPDPGPADDRQGKGARAQDHGGLYDRIDGGDIRHRPIDTSIGGCGNGRTHAPKWRDHQGHRVLRGRKTCLTQTYRQRGRGALLDHPMERIPCRQINIEGKVYAYFRGTGYLRLNSHSPIMDL